jgi:capsule polysaccharide export protein KpsE/RkpR
LFLDALLDEFRAFREQIREQQRNKALTALAEDVVKRESALKKQAETLTAFKKNNNVVVFMNGQNQSAEFLKQLMLEKNRLTMQLADADLAMLNVEASVSSRRLDASGQKAADDASSVGFTRAELDYLNTRRELAICKVDIEALKESKSPDAAKLQEAEDRKLRLDKLLVVYLAEVADALKTRKSDIERRITVLDNKIAEFTKSATEVGGKLAEFERLQRDYSEGEKAYKEMFDLVHKFQVDEGMQGDYIAIMERASAAVEDVKPWWSL